MYFRHAIILSTFGVILHTVLYGQTSAAPSTAIINSNIYDNLLALAPRDTLPGPPAGVRAQSGQRQSNDGSEGDDGDGDDGDGDGDGNDAPANEPSAYRPDLNYSDFRGVPEKQKTTIESPDWKGCPGKHCYGTCCEGPQECIPMTGHNIHKYPKYHQCCPPKYKADKRGACCLPRDLKRDGTCG